MTTRTSSAASPRARTYQRRLSILVTAGFAVALALAVGDSIRAQGGRTDPTRVNADRMMAEGETTFRDDTFGSEEFWGDTLRLHQTLAGSTNGGVGPGVSPRTALAVGLKVDSEALRRLTSNRSA